MISLALASMMLNFRSSVSLSPVKWPYGTRRNWNASKSSETRSKRCSTTASALPSSSSLS